MSRTPSSSSSSVIPAEDVLSPAQWSILAALADTIVPAFTKTAVGRNILLQHPLRSTEYDALSGSIARSTNLPPGNEVLDSFMSEHATAQPEFQDSVRNMLSLYANDTIRADFKNLLNILSSRAGALVFTGYATPVDGLPIQTREQILQSWAASRLATLRTAHNSLTLLVKLYWLRTSPSLPRVLDYPRNPLHQAIPQPNFPFDFLQFPPSPSPETIETDVVIVGSGCGGAVAAKTLAEAGLRVLVVDKAYYWAPAQLPLSERDASIHLFANGGMYQTDDTHMSIIAGSAWGGGGTINWSASLQTQGYVRREWAEKFGLGHFATSRFQADLDAVCERMGVSADPVAHNQGNRYLMEGARKLGWAAKPVPQNTGGNKHYDGHCTLGCGSCEKRGPTETWLPDAAKAGAVFMEGFEVKNLIFEDTAVSGSRVAKGVKGVWTSRDTSGGLGGTSRVRREIVVNAKKVIVAAGPLSTPLILQRSGVRNKHVGRHLHLHPVGFVGAVWNEEVKPWEGGILTSVVNEFENLDGEGYGAKLEACCMLPGWFLTTFPWHSGAQWKELAAKLKNMTGYISLARDRYGGRVYPDTSAGNDGKCRVAYTVSTYDRKHILEGMVGLAKIAYVQGAREILTTVPGLEPFVRPAADLAQKIEVTPIASPSVTDDHFDTWIAKLRSIELGGDASFASAHQMGTCRMGTSPYNSGVSPKGEVWGTSGVYVCDTSVFPSASGVNPMITVMSICRGIARGIVEDMVGFGGDSVLMARL